MIEQMSNTIPENEAKELSSIFNSSSKDLKIEENSSDLLCFHTQIPSNAEDGVSMFNSSPDFDVSQVSELSSPF